MADILVFPTLNKRCKICKSYDACGSWCVTNDEYVNSDYYCPLFRLATASVVLPAAVEQKEIE